MKEARFLIRLANSGGYSPADQAALLDRIRVLAKPLGGKVINLRVTPIALEFDLFVDPAAARHPYYKAWESIGKKLTEKRLDLPPSPVNAPAIVMEARHLFNEQRFWEVHEVLENLWKAVHGSEKQLVQGLILVAAALVHEQKNELQIVTAMLTNALTRLENQPADYFGWDVAAFRHRLQTAVTKFNVDLIRTQV